MEDDAAHVNCGGDWHIPTKAQVKELLDNVPNEWVENYNGSNISGRVFTATNGNSIFFPESGFFKHNSSDLNKTITYIQSSDLNQGYFGANDGPLAMDSTRCYLSSCWRCYGCSVRGVLDS